MHWLLALLFLACGAPLSAGPLLLAEDRPVRGIGKSATALVEAERTPLGIGDARAAQRAGRFMPVDRAEPDFGFHGGGVWLRIVMHNPEMQPLRRVLHLGTNFLPEVDVWLEATSMQHLFQQRPDSGFATRALAFHELAVPMTIPPGESILWIRYRSSGSTSLPLAIETPESMLAVAQASSAIHFTYYGIMTLFAAGAVVAFAILPRALFLAYGAYALALLLFLMQRDGHAFQFLWPDAPRWNAFASLPLGVAVGVASAQFTRLYLETPQWSPRADRVLRLMIGWGVLLLLAAAFLPDAILKQAALATASLGAVLFVALGIARMWKGGWRYGFYVAGWLAIVIAAALVAGATLLNLPIGRSATLHLTRAASVFDAAMMALAVVTGVVLLRRERDRFLQERVAMLGRNLALMGRLAKVEESQALAQSLAERRGRLLADTTHDLRQPILALKAALMRADDGNQPPDLSSARLAAAEQSLRYLEDLVERTLETAMTPDPSPNVPPRTCGDDARPANSAPEELHAGQLVAGLVVAHGEEARNLGVRLRSVGSRARVAADPLIVMRILGNFLGNAMRYGAREVLVGVRNAGRDVVIEVHDDGPGLGPEPAANFVRTGVRGSNAALAAPSGKGLGLAIVADLAAAHGLRWELENRRGRGAVARLWLPLSRDCWP